jgi:hypothetical protein
VYHRATGQWLTSPYGPGRGFNFASPRILDVLLGTNKGLFFWSPILLFSLVGFFLMHRVLPELVVAVLIVLPLQVYLVASWFDWQFGASFGHRAFTDVLPLFAVAMAVCFDRIRRTRFAVPAALGASLAVTLSVVQMLQYWVGILPMSDTSWDEYVSTFLRFSR